MKDPISDPKKKVALLKEACPAMMIKKVDAGKRKTTAKISLSHFSSPYSRLYILLLDSFMVSFASTGHCPHDEIPEEVNRIICEWIVKVDNDEQAVKTSSQQIYHSNKQN